MLPSSWKTVALFAAACMAPAIAASAQSLSESQPLELGVNYVADLANAQPGACGCFVLQGGGVSGAVRLSRHFAVAADVAAVYSGSVPGTDYGLGLITFVAGPRYSLHEYGRFAPYGQALFGAVHGFESVFPGHTGSSANSFAFEVGLGSEFRLNQRFSLRMVELNYLGTYLPNNINDWQNHLKIASGILYHF